MRKFVAFLWLAGFQTITAAHEAKSLDEILAGFGTDLANAAVRTETLAPGLHLLFGAGGNVVVSIGDQGVLMVDSQFPEMIPRLKAAIGDLGGGDIDFTINTHWHYDHANGNPLLGREGSWIVSQLNSRRMMQGVRVLDYGDSSYEQPPYPKEGLPVFTFGDEMQMHLNGQRIDIMHFGAAHTTGDAVVYFRRDNVIHMGDVFFAGYPYIDVLNGGDLNGMIAFCRAMLGKIDSDTRVVPGHGPVMAYEDLEGYVDMLETVRRRINDLLDRGSSLEQVRAAEPTAGFDDKFGNPRMFLDGAYASLSR